MLSIKFYKDDGTKMRMQREESELIEGWYYTDDR